MENTILFVAVKAVIVNDINQILLLRESGKYVDGTNTGKYDVPGGRIEVSESLTDALIREVKEETGLDVFTQELCDVHDTFTKKGDKVWHIVRLFYKVTCKEDEIILSTDHDTYKWVALDTVAEYEGVITNLLPVFEKVNAMRK